MRKLIILLFASVLMFGCSKEEAEDAMDKAGDMADEAMESAGEMADDATGAVEEMADGIKGPEVEDLPDWDSLPPIEEEMAEEGAEDGSTLMEKAEEKAGEAVEMAKDKAGEMMKKE